MLGLPNVPAHHARELTQANLLVKRTAAHYARRATRGPNTCWNTRRTAATSRHHFSYTLATDRYGACPTWKPSALMILARSSPSL
eukprot:6207107-Pleurochrysis_carterae.AAC.1